MFKNISLILVMILTFSFTAVPYKANAVSKVEIIFTTDKAQYEVGEIVTASIESKEQASMFGVDFTFNYDPAMLELQGGLNNELICDGDFQWWGGNFREEGATFPPLKCGVINSTYPSPVKKIANMKFKALKKGPADIRLTEIKAIDDNWNELQKNKECQASFSINDILVEGVSIDHKDKNSTILIGKTVVLTATITPDNATNKNLSWSSSDSSIAEVDQNGVVTGKAAGQVFISVTSDNGVKDTCKIEVSADKSKLASAITKASDLYNKAQEGSLAGQYKIGSKTALKAAIDAANAVMDKKYASLSEVEKAVADINSAIDTFKSQKITITEEHKKELSDAIDNAVQSGKTEIIIPSDQVQEGSVPVSLDLIKKAQEKKVDLGVNIDNAFISIPNNVVDISKYTNDPSNSTLIINKQDVDSNSKLEENLKLLGKIFDITLTIVDENGNKKDIHNFDNNSKVKVTIQLKSEDIKGKDTSKLAAYFFNKDTNKWEEIQGGKFDRETLRFTFETSHFTEFAIMEKTGSASDTGTVPDDGGIVSGGNIPKTGSIIDTNVLVTIGFLLAGIGLVLLLKKKHNVK